MRFVELIWKNVCRRPARSLLTAFGVTVAVASIITLLSVADALRERTAEVYQSRGVDMVVVRAGVTERLTSSLSESLEPRLAALPGVANTAPALSDLVLLHEGGITGVPLSGWRPDSFLFDLLNIVAGRRLHPEDDQGAMLGAVLAESLGKGPGDTIEIEGAEFHVVGIHRSPNFWENGSVIVLLDDMQELMDRPGQVTEYQLRLQADLAAQSGASDNLRRQIEQLMDPEGRRLGLSALPTEEYVSGSARISLVHVLALITTGIALVIGSIGMLNTMMMALLERTQEIGTLRALGWPAGQIVRLILGEALALSALGAAAGAVAAWLVLAALRQLPATHSGISPQLTGVAAGMGLLLAALFGTLGGSYPAYRGSRLLPAEAIRSE
jgi:putative ABC transport system permease protein